VFVDYYSTGELTCFLFSETKKDASDFSPTSYIIEPKVVGNLVRVGLILLFSLDVIPFSYYSSR
ncbi:hypothetical protein LQF63_11685, partial [Tetragenococcus koreensis]|uniref:hypothetical protein n=1 Tax=Tetragenococcus koreensis TaxID=290335 RepID=UPI001F39D5AF